MGSVTSQNCAFSSFNSTLQNLLCLNVEILTKIERARDIYIYSDLLEVVSTSMLDSESTKSNYKSTKANVHNALQNSCFCRAIKWDALHNLVPFIQFKKHENTHGEKLNFTRSSTFPWVFFTFCKLHKWCQIMQRDFS